MMGFFAKTVNDWIFPQKSSIIDIWHGSTYRSTSSKVFCKKSAPTNFGKFEGKNLY